MYERNLRDQKGNESGDAGTTILLSLEETEQ